MKKWDQQNWFHEKNKNEYCHRKKWLISRKNRVLWFHRKKTFVVWRKLVIKMLWRKINFPKSAKIPRGKSISHKFFVSVSLFSFWRKNIVHRAKLRQFTKALSKSWEKLLHIKKGGLLFDRRYSCQHFLANTIKVFAK